MTLLKKTLLLAVGHALFVSPIALAQEAAPTDLSVPRPAHETRAELSALGCNEVDVTNKQALLAARSLSWEIVLPADALDQSIVLCSPAVISGLQILREGQVAAAVAEALVDNSPSDGGTVPRWPSAPELNPIAKFLVWLLNSLSDVGIDLLSSLLESSINLLAVRGFLSQPFVTGGWPVALGVANLGFMLALVVIALMVTLRLNDGGSVRRLLPRFLLGALLVNFSLIIGVAIIDFSRLVMALMLSFFGYGGPEALLTAFKVEIKIAEIVTDLGNFFAAITNETTNWFGTGQVVAAMIMVVVVFALAGAALVVFVGLLVRWLVLAVLLVLSPFAYLFVAFPNTANLANMWWKQFFRYVFYAPAVLLILIVTAKFAGSEEWKELIAYAPAPNSEFASATVRATMASVLHKAAIAVGLMLAAGSGRWAGIVGSAAVMGAVSKAGARGKAVYLKGLRKGGGTMVAPVRGAAGRTGAYAGGAWAAARERYPLLRKIAPTREQLKAAGRGAVERRTPFVPPTLRARSKDEQDRANAAVGAARGAAPGATRGTLPEMSRQNLANSYVGARIAREAKGSMADVAGHGDQGTVQTLVRSAAIVRELDDTEQMDLFARIRVNASIPPGEKDKLYEELHKTIAKVQAPPGGGAAA